MNSRKLIKVFTMLAFSFFAMQSFVYAQDQEITDEDLRGYAAIENAVDLIKKSVSPTVNDLIKKQEGMTGQRFNELRKAGSDEAKMKEAGAQEWEIKFMQTVNNLMEERTEAAQEVVKLLINNSNMTVAKYTAIKNGLASDEELKARFEEIAE